MMPPVVSVVARSGTGKTTLLVKLIAELKRRNYRVGVIKHDAHRFDIDHEGKDSWRLTRAGADTMVVMSAEKIALVKQLGEDESPTLEAVVAAYYGDVDIVLTEGFKHGRMAKIEVYRRACGDPLICRGERNDPDLLAVASDSPLSVDVPLFDLNDVAGLCDLLVDTFLSVSR